jgi:hypothetical protein
MSDVVLASMLNENEEHQPLRGKYCPRSQQLCLTLYTTLEPKRKAAMWQLQTHNKAKE